MRLFGHHFTDFKSVERICWTCGYVISRDGDAAQVAEWMQQEEGCEVHCEGAWHVYKRKHSTVGERRRERRRDP